MTDYKKAIFETIKSRMDCAVKTEKYRTEFDDENDFSRVAAVNLEIRLLELEHSLLDLRYQFGGNVTLDVKFVEDLIRAVICPEMVEEE